MSSLATQSIAALAAQFRAKTLSPVDVLEEQLARIDRLDKDVNAFTVLVREVSLRAARESAARWRAGQPLSDLDGITFTAKDNYMVRGLPFRRGSLATDEAPVTETSPFVQRMQEDGAVFLGLTTMPEFGAGAVTVSPLTGITRNPWNLRLHAGGSSGGAAAAVAAGFCTVALASDAGGSIRIPSSLCGVVGFKPSGGLIPVNPPSFVGSISSTGPIGRSVADLLAVLRAGSRPDSRDPTAMPLAGSVLQNARPVAGLRVAFSIDMGYAPHVDPEVAALVKDAARHLESLGCIVEEARPPVDSPLDTFAIITRASYRHMFATYPDAARGKLGPVLKAMLSDSGEVSVGQYMAAQDHALELAARLAKFHDRYDLLVTPTVAVPAFDASLSVPPWFKDHPQPRAWSPFTSLFNLTRQPAISVPVGLTAAGLPVGMQIVGAFGRDATVLTMAQTYLKSKGDLPLPE